MVIIGTGAGAGTGIGTGAGHCVFRSGLGVRIGIDFRNDLLGPTNAGLRAPRM